MVDSDSEVSEIKSQNEKLENDYKDLLLNNDKLE